jgi:hypothetical protein
VGEQKSEAFEAGGGVLAGGKAEFVVGEPALGEGDGTGGGAELLEDAVGGGGGKAEDEPGGEVGGDGDALVELGFVAGDAGKLAETAAFEAVEATAGLEADEGILADGGLEVEGGHGLAGTLPSRGDRLEGKFAALPSTVEGGGARPETDPSRGAADFLKAEACGEVIDVAAEGAVAVGV